MTESRPEDAASTLRLIVDEIRCDNEVEGDEQLREIGQVLNTTLSCISNMRYFLNMLERPPWSQNVAFSCPVTLTSDGPGRPPLIVEKRANRISTWLTFQLDQYCPFVRHKQQHCQQEESSVPTGP